MLKPPDANDRLRAGTLPDDPFAGAVPLAADAAPIPWRSYGEVLAAADAKPRVWCVPELLPYGALVLLIGHAKRAGKSTFAWSLVAAAEHGALFLGHRIAPVHAVVLAEDADHDLADRIRLLRLAEGSGLVLSRSSVRGIPSLAALIVAAVGRAKEIGARIILVDTFAFWAALDAAAENDAGAVVAALRPLQAAADAGLLVLLVHHPSKREGVEGGVAARGSTAFAGTVEATLELRTVGDGTSPRRLLHVESRYGGTRDLLVELRRGEDAGEPDRFDLIGDAAQVESDEVKRAVLDWLRANPGWHARDAVTEGCGKRGGSVGKALPALQHKREIARAGKGKSGSPYLYATLGTPPPTPEPQKSKSVPERSPTVPGNGSPRTADRTVPAVPAPSRKGGTGNGPTARGAQGGSTGLSDPAGNGLVLRLEPPE